MARGGSRPTFITVGIFTNTAKRRATGTTRKRCCANRRSAIARRPIPNCILHGDLNNNGEIADDAIGGYAFHEHAGRGVRGEQTASPFYQFWFDDNWVARYVSEVYDRPQPSGLHDFGYPIRWRVIGGDNSRWTPYPASSPHVDQIALNGLFKLNAGDSTAHWRPGTRSRIRAAPCTTRRAAVTTIRLRPKRSTTTAYGRSCPNDCSRRARSSPSGLKFYSTRCRCTRRCSRCKRRMRTVNASGGGRVRPSMR